MTLFVQILTVAAGSAVGGACRFVVSRLLPASLMPWGTLTVNLVGCLLLGAVYGIISRATGGGETLRLFLGVGVCGGFTTFSTFINEVSSMASSHLSLNAVVYMVISLAGGLLLLRVGYKAALLFV